MKTNATITTEIIKRGRGYYEIKFYVLRPKSSGSINTWFGSGYATNLRTAQRIAKLAENNPLKQYSQVGREIVEL